jgi:membrane protein implicated in regulation of membrane protease activity
MKEEFAEKQSYWSYWVIEFNRRIDLGIEVLLTTFIVSFISLIAYFFGWGFFFHGILEGVIYFSLVILGSLPFVLKYWQNQLDEAEKKQAYYKEKANQDHVGAFYDREDLGFDN